jgi:hypothetical protein
VRSRGTAVAVRLQFEACPAVELQPQWGFFMRPTPDVMADGL